MDSNVFIDLLRAGRDSAQVIGNWAGKRKLATCGMVRLEVLRGILSPKRFASISAFMDTMVHVPTDPELWLEAADLAWKLDRRGIVIPGPDLVIAACALRIHAAVLTIDTHFQHIAGLQVIVPPPEWFAPCESQINDHRQSGNHPS